MNGVNWKFLKLYNERVVRQVIVVETASRKSSIGCVTNEQHVSQSDRKLEMKVMDRRKQQQ